MRNILISILTLARLVEILPDLVSIIFQIKSNIKKYLQFPLKKAHQSELQFQNIPFFKSL